MANNYDERTRIAIAYALEYLGKNAKANWDKLGVKGQRYLVSWANEYARTGKLVTAPLHNLVGYMEVENGNE